MGKKNMPPATHDSFRNILRRHEIFYVQVRVPHKFFFANYGARIWHWALSPQNNVDFWTFQNGWNPGGDLEICDILFARVCTLYVSANSNSISYSANFGYQIILKFPTEIFMSKFPNRNFWPLIYKSLLPIPGGPPNSGDGREYGGYQIWPPEE